MIINENKYLLFDRPKRINYKYRIKQIISIFHQVYYKSIMNSAKIDYSPSVKYNVSICAMFRDESEYLKEWIEFHRIVGVDHFYLYNNFSEDNYLEVLKPYIDEGIVTLTDWPYKQAQFQAYEDFFAKFGCDSRWVGLIDIDEFIVPNKFNSIYDFLKSFEKRSCVIINWRLFGASGIIDRNTKRLITEDFIVGSSKYMDIGKVFVNTKFADNICFNLDNNMHSLWMKYKHSNLPPVNVFDKVCTYGFNNIRSSDLPIQINHYVVKSWNEYVTKKSKRGGGVHDISMHNMNYFYRHDGLCNVPDYSAYKYLIKLKQSLKIDL